MALSVLCGDGRGYDSSAPHFVYSSAKLTSGFVPRPLLLQSAFSLKIRVQGSYYLSQCDCKQRLYVTIKDWDQTRKDLRPLLSRLAASPLAAGVLGFRVQ